MNKECLDFFKEKFPEHSLQVSDVENTPSYIMFTIESKGPILCITLKFLKTKPEMEIELIKRQNVKGIGGTKKYKRY